MTQVKICGLTREEDIAAVNRWLPDYIGFVFADSRRQVTPDQAYNLKAKLDFRIKAVGVFVNEPVENVIELCQAKVIDAVQLHGDEAKAYLQKLQQRTPCPVIKAVRVKSSRQILQAQELPCDLLLLDRRQKGQYGGSGKTFDHSLIPALQKPFFLAGGLHCGNILPVVREYRPFGVDISSGVETNHVKDADKIRRIIQIIREESERWQKDDSASTAGNIFPKR